MTPRHRDLLSTWAPRLGLLVTALALVGTIGGAALYYQPRASAEAAANATSAGLSAERRERMEADHFLGERLARVEESGSWQLWYLQQLGQQQGIAPPRPIPRDLLPPQLSLPVHEGGAP